MPHDAKLRTERVDYTDPQQGAELLRLLNDYACDPMGGGQALAEEVRQRLLPALAGTPGTFSFLARIDGQAVGLINCITGFSTFKAAPLVNIHDVYVDPEFRGRGVTRALFEAVEGEAQARACCKVTLEVLSGNLVAKAVYARLGFDAYVLDPQQGEAEFWQKNLRQPASYPG